MTTTPTTELNKEKKDREKQIVQHKGTATSGGGIKRLVPQTFGELENLAVMLGKSDIVPKDMIGKPANILLALMFGNELGLTPAQALQNVMIINGRPNLWGDAVMGLVMASDVYEDSRDSYDPATKTAKFEIKRRGKEWLTRTFSMADAVTAKLDKKEGPWQQYPTRMLFHRARAWACRDAFPDVLKGIRYHEEERDFVDTTAERVTPRTYALPKEAVISAPKEETTAHTEQPAATIETFKCGGGATVEFEGDPNCFIVRDDQDPPTKYFHNNAEFHAMAKTAKSAKAFLTASWIEKSSSIGPVRWIVSLSLKA